MKKLLFYIIFLLTGNSYAQDSAWTLQGCINYALENNLTIKQNDFDRRLAVINKNTAKNALYPSISLSTNAGTNLGRSINPTTNQFENTQFTYSGLSGSTNILVFGWFQKRYAIEKSNIQVLQSSENFEQIKDDIILNISTAYFRILLAKEQIANVSYQIELSAKNKLRIEKLLSAGKSNILELSQAATQLSTDSGLYITSVLDLEQALLDLKVILNFDFEKPMDIAYIIIDSTKAFNHRPETVFEMAINSYHGIRSNEYAIQVAQKEIQISKAASLPSVNLFYSAGTNYSSSFYENLPNGERHLMNFGRQLNSNLSHSIGIGLSIPIFNNSTSKNAIKTNKIGLEKAYLANKEGLLKLKKDVYAACIDYDKAKQKLDNAHNILKHTEKAFNAATVRYEAGLIAYFEYLTEKNNYMLAQHDVSNLKYELEFKKKLIERFMN